MLWKFWQTAPKSKKIAQRVSKKITEHRSLGNNPELGFELPSLCKRLKMENLKVDHDTYIAQGASEIALTMKMNCKQLREKYLATNNVIEEDLFLFSEFSGNPDTLGIYYSNVATIAQRSGKVDFC